MIHALIVHEMATWEITGAEQSRRRPTRSRRRRPRVCHGVSIGSQGWLARAAAALHQLQRGLSELHQLLARGGRERLHRCHERRELLHDGVVRGHHALGSEQLLELRRRSGPESSQHQEQRCLP